MSSLSPVAFAAAKVTRGLRDRERRYTKAFVLNLIKLILKHNHSQRQSRPRRHTNAPRPEGFPPLSALQSRPKKTQTQTY